MTKDADKQRKGLPDKDLVKKYESGKFNLKKATKSMLESGRSAAFKEEKQTKKKNQ